MTSDQNVHSDFLISVIYHVVLWHLNRLKVKDKKHRMLEKSSLPIKKDCNSLHP